MWSILKLINFVLSLSRCILKLKQGFLLASQCLNLFVENFGVVTDSCWHFFNRFAQINLTSLAALCRCEAPLYFALSLACCQITDITVASVSTSLAACFAKACRCLASRRWACRVARLDWHCHLVECVIIYLLHAPVITFLYVHLLLKQSETFADIFLIEGTFGG